MSNIFDFFPSNFLKAADLGGQPRQVTIESFVVETMNDGTQKPALCLVGVSKKLVLNRTNATAIANAFGPDVNGWMGKQLNLFSTPVSFQGRLTDAIRVQATSSLGGAQSANVFANPTQQSPATPPPEAAQVENAPTTENVQLAAATPPAEQAVNWEV